MILILSAFCVFPPIWLSCQYRMAVYCRNPSTQPKQTHQTESCKPYRSRPRLNKRTCKMHSKTLKHSWSEPGKWFDSSRISTPNLNNHNDKSPPYHTGRLPRQQHLQEGKMKPPGRFYNHPLFNSGYRLRRSLRIWLQTRKSMCKGWRPNWGDS